MHRQPLTSSRVLSIALVAFLLCIGIASAVHAQDGLASMTPAQLHVHGNRLMAAGDSDGAMEVFNYVIDNVEDESYLAGAHYCLAVVLSK